MSALLRSALFRSYAVLLVLTMLPFTAAAGHKKYLRVDIHFLATSTSVQSSFGESEDVYLVELTMQGGEPFPARLIDGYPPYETGFTEGLLTSGSDVTGKVRRDNTCDIAFGEMPLRTAPGNPLAVLPEKLGYTPRLSRPIPSGEVLPCYRIVRR